jgi:low affinity Fe/Cu permease
MAQQTSFFVRFAHLTAQAAGKPVTFLIAVAIIVGWGVSGPLFGFSDTWQLVINTGTTIITFLMVFLIQNTQNRDTQAIQLKLDELIVAIKAASNEVLDAEDFDDEDLRERHQAMMLLADEAKNKRTKRKKHRTDS